MSFIEGHAYGAGLRLRPMMDAPSRLEPTQRREHADLRMAPT
jgi:hypothetical protein